jgi:glycosyltransferase involved in cell wall biosynthesis
MNSETAINERISNTKTCVIIPTYNNHKTLQRVIDGVLIFTKNVIIVNDGSTDTTTQILESYAQLTIVTISQNQGKGNALRNGFKKALDLGFDYAITIDSDGQHYPDDIPVFINALEHEKQPVLLIGNRNMAQDGIPKKSSFGNNFSNFWFWFETGIRLEDTQSGYRLYPLQQISKRFFTRKFEFEIEVIVRTAWKDIPVKNVPIKILYDPNERVSHFRPFKDFTRISILNTILVIVTLFYIKPRNFFKSFKKKSFRQFVKDDILESSDSNTKKALSIALGVFVGIAPFWGFQSILAISLAVFLRLNKVISFAASNISIPPMIPFILYGSLVIGNYFVGNENNLVFDASLTFDAITNNLFQYTLGSFIFATIMAAFFGLISFFVLNYFSTFKNKKS